jgi:hypothetical protein
MDMGVHCDQVIRSERICEYYIRGLPSDARKRNKGLVVPGNAPVEALYKDSTYFLDSFSFHSIDAYWFDQFSDLRH